MKAITEVAQDVIATRTEAVDIDAITEEEEYYVHDFITQEEVSIIQSWERNVPHVSGVI